MNSGQIFLRGLLVTNDLRIISNSLLPDVKYLSQRLGNLSPFIRFQQSPDISLTPWKEKFFI